MEAKEKLERKCENPRLKPNATSVIMPKNPTILKRDLVVFNQQSKQNTTLEVVKMTKDDFELRNVETDKIKLFEDLDFSMLA